MECSWLPANRNGSSSFPKSGWWKCTSCLFDVVEAKIDLVGSAHENAARQVCSYEWTARPPPCGWNLSVTFCWRQKSSAVWWTNLKVITAGCDVMFVRRWCDYASVSNWGSLLLPCDHMVWRHPANCFIVCHLSPRKHCKPLTPVFKWRSRQEKTIPLKWISLFNSCSCHERTQFSG